MNIIKNTLAVGVEKPFIFLHISDIHLSETDENDSEERRAFAQGRKNAFSFAPAALEFVKDYVKKTGCALLLVTHSLQQARRIADEVLYFHKGELAEAGTTEQVLHNPESEKTRQFLEFYGV